MTNRCDCGCFGCSLFHHDGDIGEGREAHQSRLLLALDRSIQALCRSRGIAACNGLDEDDQHEGACEVGDLHTRAGLLAFAMGIAFEDPTEATATKVLDAMASLLIGIDKLTSGKPRVS